MKCIEYRVHLKHDANDDEVREAAETLHDEIMDAVSDPCAPSVFTQDVTYEIRGEDNGDFKQLRLNFEKES
jgi:hypothetical protein